MLDKVKISLIVAMSQNRVIGINGKMPWHISADLKHFRQVTWGKPIVMGRKTFESLGKPLPGRRNIVISQNPDYRPEGCETVSSAEAALEMAASDEIMVIGGAMVYGAFIERAQQLYITLIHHDFAGDTYFPEWQESDWEEQEYNKVAFDPDCGLSYSFIRLCRKGEQFKRNAPNRPRIM